MTKSEIKEKLWIMENFCNGKSANVGRNEVLGNDEQSVRTSRITERKRIAESTIRCITGRKRGIKNESD